MKKSLPASEIFRAEALDHHVKRGPVEGSLLELSPGWVRLTYWLLLLVLLSGFAFLSLATVAERLDAPAIVYRAEPTLTRGTPALSVVVMVPAAAAANVRTGTALVVRLPGESVRAVVTSIEPEPVLSTDVPRALGLALPTTGAPPSMVRLVHAELSPADPDGSALQRAPHGTIGTAEFITGKRRIIETVLPALRASKEKPS